MFLTQSRLGTSDFNENEILKMIRALDINKAHGNDDTSIRMIVVQNGATWRNFNQSHSKKNLPFLYTPILNPFYN